MQPHYGGVKIENNAYIGPLSNIERGTIEDTIISQCFYRRTCSNRT